MNDQVTLEIVRTRCTSCGHACYCLIDKLTPARDFLTRDCGCCHARALHVESARGLAFRQVTIGTGARWDVPAPMAHELHGIRPARGPRQRGAR